LENHISYSFSVNSTDCSRLLNYGKVQKQSTAGNCQSKRCHGTLAYYIKPNAGQFEKSDAAANLPKSHH